MNWPFIVGGLFIIGALTLWLAVSWRHPDRRSGNNPDDWPRITGGGTGSNSGAGSTPSL